MGGGRPPRPRGAPPRRCPVAVSGGQPARGPAPGTAAHPWRLTGGGLVRRGRTALRSAPLVCTLVVGALLAGTATAAAAPPPTDPGDEALSRSRTQVTERAAEVGQLTGRLAELDARTDDLQADLAARREDAASALDDLTAAQAAAAEAARRADEAGGAPDAASPAADDPRAGKGGLGPPPHPG